MADNIQKNVEVIDIVPDIGHFRINFAELWSYRELLFFLAWRDIKVRYKQTVMGVLWAFIQPFVSMVVFTLFFNRLVGIQPGGNVPYEIFSYSALVPWAFFTGALTSASVSMVGNANLIKKVYFPRLLIPLATVFGRMLDFVLAFTTLILMMLVFGIVPTVNIIWLPVFVLQILMIAMGIGFWLSAMNVQFRDIRYTVPFITQVWMFISPIVYPSSLIENDVVRILYGINPMAGVIDGFRWALLGAEVAPPPNLMLIVSFAISFLLLFTGVIYFKRAEKTFADVI